MLADLRDALRQLRKAPGFTTTAVVTLALGIGATTAIFTLVHQVMLKSLPVTKPDELWRIGDKVRCCNWGGYTQGDDGDFALFSWEAYKKFRDHTPEFSELAALQAGNAPLGVRRAGSQGQVDTRNGEYVSGNFFRTFGRAAVDWPPDDRGGRPGGRASGGGDELPDLEGEVRLRSFGGGGKLPDQWKFVHRDRGSRAGVLWRQVGGRGHAGSLAALDDGVIDRWVDLPAEETERELSRSDWEGAAGSRSEDRWKRS